MFIILWGYAVLITPNQSRGSTVLKTHVMQHYVIITVTSQYNSWFDIPLRAANRAGRSEMVIKSPDQDSEVLLRDSITSSASCNSP